MRVLITGATGFLGSHVTRALLHAGHDVVAAHRSASSRRRLQDVDTRLRWVEMNLGDAPSIHATVSETCPTAVIHCAGYGMNYAEQSFEDGIACNILGTRHLVQASAQAEVRRFIHAGSCFEYGNKAVPVSEDEVLAPISMYGVTKAAATLLAVQQSKALGLPTVVLRPFGVYGSADRGDKFIPQVIRACLTRVAVDLSGGEQVRDYVYIRDIVALHVQLVEMDRFPNGQIFNIAGGCPVPLRRIGEIIGRTLNFSEGLRWGARPYHRDEIKTLTAQTAKAKQVLGWSASTSLEEGLAETIQWYRQERATMSLDG